MKDNKHQIYNNSAAFYVESSLKILGMLLNIVHLRSSRTYITKESDEFITIPIY